MYTAAGAEAARMLRRCSVPCLYSCTTDSTTHKQYIHYGGAAPEPAATQPSPAVPRHALPKDRACTAYCTAQHGCCILRSP
jgi:hypothetical protein